MATATASSYSVVTLGEAAEEAAERGFGLGGPPNPEDGRRGRVALRRDLDIGSVGGEADYPAPQGAAGIGGDDELRPRSGGHRGAFRGRGGGAPVPLGGGGGG